MPGAQYDVVVLGGGVAGLAAAIHIRQKSAASVLVVEMGDGCGERVGETVPPDILTPLHRLGLADVFRESGHLPCPGSVSAWGSDKLGFNDFILNPLGCAWHLNRRRFERMLLDRAVELGAMMTQRTRFAGSELRAGHILQLRRDAEEYQVEARWVLDATGATARFARGQGARQQVQDRLVAMACFAEVRTGSLSAQTFLEATRDGWWYAARLPENRVVTMLVTEAEDVQRLAAAGHALWKEQLRSTSLVGPRLAECSWEQGEYLHVPVVSSVLDPVEGPRWMAIGDAASSYDPIASQGIHKALVDAGDAAAHVVAELGFGARPRWSYASRVRDRFEDYLKNRAFLYGQEQRWPDAAFWSRRAMHSRT